MSKSGHLLLDGDIIRYRSDLYGHWQLPVSSVRILGEATNQGGPGADDYFFYFATGPGPWYQASYYADGCEEFLKSLATKLGHPLELGLGNSADFASRILWPPSLASQPLFQFHEVPPKGPLRKLFGLSTMNQTYTDPVAAFLSTNT